MNLNVETSGEEDVLIFKDHYAFQTYKSPIKSEPHNFEVSKVLGHSVHYFEAIKEELYSIERNKFWELVEYPDEGKPSNVCAF